MRRYLLPLLAILGIGVTIVAIVMDNREAVARPPAVAPAHSPFASFIAGAGLVEASTGNIAIGSPVSGVAMEIDVHVGDRVGAGDAFFRIDDRDLRAQLLTALARVKTAEVAMLQPRHRLDYIENLGQRDPGAVSAETKSDLRDQLAMAEAELRLANAEVAKLNLDIERRTVRAPVAGRVLQLNLRIGEYVDSAAAPVLLFGDDSKLYVRVDIDESDAWRYRAGAVAVGFLRGQPQSQIPLAFEYVEPHVIPKTSLTGRSGERTDTRVLQVLYSFPPLDSAIYSGQQLDVFIEAPSATNREQ